jgi:hypothetical protein
MSPAMIATDINTTALEGHYDFKILLNIHVTNLRGSCETAQDMLLGLYDAVMLTAA